MPEVILPCPACGADSYSIQIIYDQNNNFWDECCECEMRGPRCPTRESAIAAWNALPRALPWTDEPPKVAGVYLIRSIFDGEQQGDVGVITVKTPFDYDKSHFMQFAGPIAPPVEG